VKASSLLYKGGGMAIRCFLGLSRRCFGVGAPVEIPSG